MFHRLSRTLGVATLLILPATAGAQGLEEGDRFSARVEYSNSWEEVAISGGGVAPGRGGPASLPQTGGKLGPAAPGQISPQLNARIMEVVATPIASDPLYVTMDLSGVMKAGNVLQLQADVSKVHYFDDRNRRWTVHPRKPRSKELAIQMAKDLSLAWRRDFRSRIEREMLEEQLLGVGIILMHNVRFQVVLAGKDPMLEGFQQVLDEALPETYPRALRESLAWFFRESISRLRGPDPGATRKGRSFEADGLPYRVLQRGKRRGRPIASVQGQVHKPKVGVVAKERALIDLRSGLVLEGTSITLHETIAGNASRFGSVRWNTKLTGLKPGKRSRRPHTGR